MVADTQMLVFGYAANRFNVSGVLSGIYLLTGPSGPPRRVRRGPRTAHVSTTAFGVMGWLWGPCILAMQNRTQRLQFALEGSLPDGCLVKIKVS